MPPIEIQGLTSGGDPSFPKRQVPPAPQQQGLLAQMRMLANAIFPGNAAAPAQPQPQVPGSQMGQPSGREYPAFMGALGRGGTESWMPPATPAGPPVASGGGFNPAPVGGPMPGGVGRHPSSLVPGSGSVNLAKYIDPGMMQWYMELAAKASRNPDEPGYQQAAQEAYAYLQELARVRMAEEQNAEMTRMTGARSSGGHVGGGGSRFERNPIMPGAPNFQTPAGYINQGFGK